MKIVWKIKDIFKANERYLFIANNLIIIVKICELGEWNEKWFGCDCNPKL